MDRKQIGRIGLAQAINYFTLQGYTVSLPINDTQWYDLIVEQNGEFKTVQCKATATEDGSIDFRSSGGTHGSIYGHALDTPVDIMFCVDKDLHIYVKFKRGTKFECKECGKNVIYMIQLKRHGDI